MASTAGGKPELSLSELLQIFEERGLSIVIENGSPKLRGNTQAVTEALMRVLKRRRAEIVEHFSRQEESEPYFDYQPDEPPPQQPSFRYREWLDNDWRHYAAWEGRERFGKQTTFQVPNYADMAYHPQGVRWWRFVGEREWRPINPKDTAPVPPPGAPDNVPDGELWRYL